jgi:hypothetical protein
MMAKDNIRRATDEARKDIPRYTQAVNEYHEQTIQTAREIADNYLRVGHNSRFIFLGDRDGSDYI